MNKIDKSKKSLLDLMIEAEDEFGFPLCYDAEGGINNPEMQEALRENDR